MTIYVKKGLQRHHISHITLGPQITFGATPYEGRTFPINATPSLSSGLVWDYAGGHATFTASSGAERADVKLQSAKGSGMGWTFTHQAKGRGYDYSQFKGGRAIGTYIAELADGGDSTWVNRSGGLVANSIILHDGVSSQRGPNGLDVLTIQSATPDYFLGKLELPQMSYLLGTPANKERYSWWFLCTNGFEYDKPWPTPIPTSPDLIRASIQNVLGRTLKGAGMGGIADLKYQDQLGGFAYHTDQYTITVGEAMQPRPCNEHHLVSALSGSRVLCELMRNHVKVSTGGQVHAIGDVFDLTDVRVDGDLERDVFTINVSGTINSIIQTLAENGVWRTWWDSYCNFHFIPDYYGVGAGTPSLILQEGPSLIGTLEVNTGSDYPIVNRAGVKLTDFASFGDATTDPLTSNINMALGSVYPPGQPAGGNDVNFDHYWGRNTAEQARRLYNRANARTTFRWSNFPYPTLAFGMLNRVAQITARDPKGNWSFSGKNFVVTEVEINLQDGDRPDGGYYLCSISGIEI